MLFSNGIEVETVSKVCATLQLIPLDMSSHGQYKTNYASQAAQHELQENSKGSRQRYYSLPGFFNRKAAEQSAAEVALVELAKSGDVNQSISQPVQTWRALLLCLSEIGGIRYIGAAAKTKIEAEIKAARTALLAIQSSASNSSGNLVGHSQLTVIPCKKRGAESVADADESVITKPKKARLKRKTPKRGPSGDKMGYKP
ncbi:hypothetical protein L6164_030686 [Bauhinia variegata]|uniref:Uncharacterized protein n=1 Tax=Bauhinia variegata TaxID=167791 RepID=A0ACB9LDG7_BAUVA|nr:hypothetical protein L6164_030686 [Bauhinia variegata]